jgi:hypothetical protein
MKTILLTSGMTLKERDLATHEVISEIDDSEPFKVIEELTIEKLRNDLQATIDIVHAYSERKVRVDGVTLDHDRNLVVIEYVYDFKVDTEE